MIQRIAAALLLICATRAAVGSLDISLPEWAVQINANSDVNPHGDGQSRSTPQPALDRNDSDDETLLAWSSRMGDHDDDNDDVAQSQGDDPDSAFLVVGAKTSVVYGFANRQALRQTWATASSDTRVVFLGCAPDLSMHSPTKRALLEQAIEREKRTYGDLLTTELIQCQDSFGRLADKVKAFMHWVIVAYPSLAYAMVIDDDVYLRVDRVLALLRRETTPRERFFGGNSATNEYRGLAQPIRNPAHKYFVPVEVYPMAELPPFLTGAHYILSRDLVQFIARNVYDLHGLGALDDVTIGLWLFALLHVKQTFIRDLEVLRSTKSCHEQLLSLADLSTATIRHVHDNILSQRPMCDGFLHLVWIKKMRSIIVPAIADADDDDGTRDQNSDLEADSSIHWDLQHDDVANRLQIAINLTAADLSVAFVYIPSQSSVAVGFCGRASKLLQENLFVTVGDEWCAFNRHVLRSALKKTSDETPGMRALLALASHNLKRSALDYKQKQRAWKLALEHNAPCTHVDPPPVVVALSRGAVQRGVRVFIECLFVAMYPERQVLVLNADTMDPSRQTATVDLVVVVSSLDLFRAGPQLTKSARDRTVFVLDDEPVSSQGSAAWPPHAIVISASSLRPGSSRLVHVPIASREFAYSVAHSPMELLQPTALFDGERQTIRRHFGASCHPSVGDDSLVDRLSLIGTVGMLAICDHSGRNSDSQLSRFRLDQAVEQLRNYQFTVVEDDGSFVPGHICTELLAAFLAGSIPVYYYHSQNDYDMPSSATADLFNSRAFISCANVVSCAGRVKELVDSTVLYDKMRNEPAIVNEESFTTVFAWHPLVAEMVRTRQTATGSSPATKTASETLRQWVEENNKHTKFE